VARVDAEVRFAQGFLDGVHGGFVVGADEDGTSFLDGDRGELLQGGGRTVVVDHQLVEHGGVGAAGADGAEVFAHHFHGLVHLVFGLEKGLLDHSCSLGLLLAGWAVTTVPIFSPLRAPATFPSMPMPNTRIVRALSRHRASAVESTTRRSRRMASAKVR